MCIFTIIRATAGANRVRPLVHLRIARREPSTTSTADMYRVHLMVRTVLGTYARLANGGRE